MGLENVKHIILVLSGKGGVGKSSITVQLAFSLAAAGHAVGVLDVDLTGPSIPRMLAIENAKITQGVEGLVPVTVNEPDPKLGIGRLTAISLGLVADKGDSIVWRGPKKTAMVSQFLNDVAWPADTEYLLIDTPPGTSDEHITLVEKLNVEPHRSKLGGAVVVTTPQAVATADVRKELNFCKKGNIQVIGVIENMSGFVCPHCSTCTNIFSKGGGQAMADEFQVPFLGCVPLDAQFSKLIETGEPPNYPQGTKTATEATEATEASVAQPASVPHRDTAEVPGTTSELSGGNAVSLVEIYKRCALAEQFGEITRTILLSITAAS